MGRPPCCDKVGIKKGPWTPEEDIILVSYIQEHGPGNWRSVPTNTGLSRCSKSCRLRWTNYLRPGIKRGNFTPHEEGMIIHLQALLGNKWAAIASYLPQRTDNDIKNYWNTHLKKKLKKLQASSVDLASNSSSSTTTTTTANNHHHHQYPSSSKGFSDRIRSADSLDINNNNNNNNNGSSSTITYASSTENISRLLEGWMRASPKPLVKEGTTILQGKVEEDNNNFEVEDDKMVKSATSVPVLNLELVHQHEAAEEDRREEQDNNNNNNNNIHEEFDSILSFDNLKAGDHDHDHDHDDDGAEKNVVGVSRQRSCHDPPPLSFLEKWLLDENVGGQVEEMMELSPMF